jgi:putative acetyltransferase
MKDDLIIRIETPADYAAAENLTREAFWNVYRPGCTEHFVLHTFRGRPEFVPELSLVMELGGKAHRPRHVRPVGNPG